MTDQSQLGLGSDSDRVTGDRSNPSWDCYVTVTRVTSDKSNPSWDWVVTVTRVTSEISDGDWGD